MHPFKLQSTKPIPLSQIDKTPKAITHNQAIQEIEVTYFRNYWYYGIALEFEIPEPDLKLTYSISKSKDAPLSKGNRILFKAIKENFLFFTIIDCEVGMNEKLEEVYVQINAKKNGKLAYTLIKHIPKKVYNIGTYEQKLEFRPEGFDPELLQEYKTLWEQVAPIMKEEIGMSALPATIPVVVANRYLFNYKRIQIEFKNKNRKQTFIHEIVHSLFKGMLLSRNARGYYVTTYEKMDEAFAEASSLHVLELWRQKYNKGRTPYKNPYDGDYDFRNSDALISKNIWTENNAMWLTWDRYKALQAMLTKVANAYRRNTQKSLFKDLLQRYYDELNKDPHYIMNRTKFIKILSELVLKVEGYPLKKWIEKQKVFKFAKKPGPKIYVQREINYSGDQAEFILELDIYAYTTFANGSDWYYVDKQKNRYKYNQNGQELTVNIYDYDNKLVFTLTTPTTPIEHTGYSKIRLILSNATNADASNHAQRMIKYYAKYPKKEAHYAFIQESGLYRITITDKRNNVIQTFYQPLGEVMSTYAEGLVLCFPFDSGVVDEVTYNDVSLVTASHFVSKGIVALDNPFKANHGEIRIGGNFGEVRKEVSREVRIGNERGGYVLLLGELREVEVLV